ncbi:MAG: YihY/virulence factor BrkB family protein [Dissulfurispiraceae bacterium]|jgi:membrane protein|nr:YihY/virulence factor BrkB family protein [Dissulfurispiraceae bacterium]
MLKRMRIFPRIFSDGLRLILKSFGDFFRDNGIMLAGSISYFSMMALIPLCLFIITLFGYFLGNDTELLKYFSSKLINFFPKATSEIASQLQKIITYKKIGHISILIYGLLSFQLLSALETATNSIFKTEKKRHFALSFILQVLILTLIAVLIVMSFGATSAISLLTELKDYFPHIKISAFTKFVIKYIVPFVLITLSVAVMYILLPVRRVKISSALKGAFFTAVMYETAKNLFTFYVAKATHLGTVYGPLSAFTIFLLWVYYSASIFLTGAELVHNIENRQVR